MLVVIIVNYSNKKHSAFHKLNNLTKHIVAKYKQIFLSRQHYS